MELGAIYTVGEPHHLVTFICRKLSCHPLALTKKKVLHMKHGNVCRFDCTV
jgi:hypothetical protein